MAAAKPSYSVVGIYVGGANRTNKVQVNLKNSWTLFANCIAYSFAPIWVWPQAQGSACSNCLETSYTGDSATEAKLAYMAHVLSENRSDLVMDVRLTQATGTTEHEAAVEMLKGKPASKPATLGADRGYDTAGFVKQLRGMKITPHVVQNDSHRHSAVNARTTRHDGYAISQRKRKRVEEILGWMKTVGLHRKTRFLGPDRTDWMFTFAAAAYNLVRMRNLQA